MRTLHCTNWARITRSRPSSQRALFCASVFRINNAEGEGFVILITKLLRRGIILAGGKTVRMNELGVKVKDDK